MLQFVSQTENEHAERIWLHLNPGFERCHQCPRVQSAARAVVWLQNTGEMAQPCDSPETAGQLSCYDQLVGRL